MDLRFQQLNHWLLTACQLSTCRLEPPVGDASFRRYYRVWQGESRFIAMDAPPARETSTKAFAAQARLLGAAGLCVPEVLVADFDQGFLLLTDLGERTYLQALTVENADDLYGRALSALATMQACDKSNLSLFNEEFMFKELQTFKEWFLQTHLKLDLSAATERMLENYFYFLAEVSAAQPQVYMHRDYQSANLMVLPDAQVGILDFQDAFSGPLTYDLVSLLRDCYVAWPEAWVIRWVLQYKASLPAYSSVSDEVFLRWFDVMGMQRHFKSVTHFFAQISARCKRQLFTTCAAHAELCPGGCGEFPGRCSVSSIFNRYRCPSISKGSTLMRGMILAAGRGARMGALTENLPKPLLRVNGRYLIEYSLRALVDIGVEDIVINICYHREQIKAALGNGRHYGANIHYSEEVTALETGGGILQALPYLGSEPFIVLSSDVVCDYSLTNLPRDPAGLAHLVMVENPVYHPRGDYCLMGERIFLGDVDRYTFGNIGIYRPELFQHLTPGHFRLGTVLSSEIQNNNITGELYQGFWHNLGNPDQLAVLEDTLSMRSLS